MSRVPTLAIVVTTTLALSLLAAPAAAQGRKKGRIPPGHLPPAGQCRVWYDDRPPGHQPPPTDCATARLAAREGGGRVVYGGGSPSEERYDVEVRVVECDGRGRAGGECVPDDERCLDRDRDGWCDGLEPDPDECWDRDHDGRCDDASDVRPAALPEMILAVIFVRGEPVAEVQVWLGTLELRVRLVDDDEDGVPEVVTWTDAEGRVLQRWLDDDRDGRADRIGFYRDDRLVRVVR